MATETQIGSLTIDLKIKLEALERGLETAKQKIQELEQSNNQIQKSNKGIDASYLAMSATAVASLMKIKSAISDCVEEYTSYTQAMSSLKDVSDYTDESMQDLSGIMNKFSKYMTKSDLAATIKNFTLMGYSAQDTEKMITSLTNSAIKNRNANYSVSEAVKTASEGYRQGLSTLSDSAGVTENLSVMQSEYAKSIGKTASQLTELEINQAYLNRTMQASEPFAGAMEEYLDSLAGKQGQYSQAMRETQVAYAEALEPVMSKALEVGTQLLGMINSFITEHPALTQGMTTFAITLGVVTIAMIALKKAKDAYATSTLAATIATKGFTAALMANPIFLIATAIATAITGISMLCSAIKENEEEQAKLNEVTERYKQIKEDSYGFTDENIAATEQDKENIKEQIKLKEEQIELAKKLKEYNMSEIAEAGSKTSILRTDEEKEIWKLTEALVKNRDELKKLQKENGNYGDSLEELNERLKDNTDFLEEADAVKKITKGLDTETIKKQQQEAAQLKINAQTMQQYLDIVKKGDKSTSQYQEAVKQLAQAYPEAANAGGIIEEEVQRLIDAEALDAQSKWASAQEKIKAEAAIIQAALNSEAVQKQVAQNIGVSVDELNTKLQSTLALYNAMAKMEATEVQGITPVSVSAPKLSSSGGSKKSSSSYENKALDNYKKQIEHKKALDQLSLKDEISMYETALRKYAKTADEKNEIREKIYELNKELAKKEKELLEQQTEDYENYMQEQKNLRGAAYDVKEQTSDYDKIIRMHKSYLNQIMKDERLSLDERKEIYREELQTIRDYEQQKRDLRVESVDNTVSQLTTAITKQLEEMQKKDKELIDKNIEAVEKWKNARINAINEEYDARIEAIEKELEALDKAEQQKTRDEEDAEYERKKLRLQQLIDYEHDATTKANYQKELDKLVADYQKTLDSRALADKKEALNAQKDLLKEEQENQVQIIENQADAQKEIYDKQLDELEEYYDKQIDMAQETAEQMLLNVEQNQDKILNLLKSYGDKYEITGQTLGEKLAQGINEGIADKIQNVIQRIQDTIDSNLESKIREWTSSGYSYEASSGKPTSSISVVQHNYIQQNPEMPSELYRKLRNIDEELAADLAGL